MTAETLASILRYTDHITFLTGAGLSASSGPPTFRGAGGLWRNHRAMDLATPEAFERDPGLVWLFYGYRRHMAMEAVPGEGHRTLAIMSEKYPHFLCVSQNVDSKLPPAPDLSMFQCQPPDSPSRRLPSR